MGVFKLGTGRDRRGLLKATRGNRAFNGVFARLFASGGINCRLHYEPHGLPFPAGPIEQADA